MTWRHLLQRIRSHESSTHHAEECVTWEQWRNRWTIEEALLDSLLEKTNFWQNVLERLVNVALMLTKCNLPIRGSSEELPKDNKGNFLSIIQLLARYNTVLDKLLQLPKGSRTLIQNELISVLAEEVLRDIKSQLQNAPFLPLFLISLKMSAKKTGQVKYFFTSKSITTMMERHQN